MQLKTARKLAGLTQAQLSRLAKVNQATVSRLESGDIRNPSLRAVMRICRALNESPHDISEFRVGDRL